MLNLTSKNIARDITSSKEIIDSLHACWDVNKVEAFLEMALANCTMVIMERIRHVPGSLPNSSNTQNQW